MTHLKTSPPSSWFLIAWLALLPASAVLALDLPAGKCAALQPLGTEFRPSSEFTFDVAFPDVAADDDGNYVVVFESFNTSLGNDNDRHSIHGRRFAADGTPLGAQFQVNTLGADEQRYPSVAMAPDGRFVVVWRSGKNFGPKQIRARRYRANGTAIGGDFVVHQLPNNPDRDSHQTYPQVAMHDDGTFLVTWESRNSAGNDDSNTSVQARIFGSNGAARTPQFQVNVTTESDQKYPEVAVGPDGVFWVVWESFRSAGNDNNLSVQLRRFDGAGNPRGGEVQVNSFTSGNQRYPAVAVTPLGNAMVVWQSDGSPGSDQDEDSIQAQGYAFDGSAIGTQFQINQADAGDQSKPQITAGIGGDFVVAWESDDSLVQPRNQRSVQARHIASPGRFFDLEFRVNTTFDKDQEQMALAASPVGAMVVYYSDTVDNSIDQTVLAQRLTPTIAPEALCLNSRRFLVEVDWQDSQGASGRGQAVVGGSDDSGLFWFFESNNWEMLVKVLDACSLNDRHWVFSAATTDMRYTLRVVDLITGDTNEYFNPLGNAAAAITDAEAFATCGANPSLAGAENPVLRRVDLLDPPDGVSVNSWQQDLLTERGWLPGWSLPGGSTGRAQEGAGDIQQVDAAVCSASDSRLCLAGSRFRVEVDWRNASGETGNARTVPFGSDDSGLLYFFEPNNWEMLVKILDGCSLNGRFWVYSAATTDVEYTLRVTDTSTGVVSEYFNPLGTAAAAITDTDAFATCQ